ncbi:MAG: GNAT family N-acetyltransferase, partial [Desulfobacteraceae bacterium]
YYLKKAGEMIAFEFHLIYNRITYPIRADFNESFRHLSPGSILEAHILKDLFDESRIREYNTCGHTYDYLMNWTQDTRRYVNVELFNKGFKPRALHALEYSTVPFLKKMGLNQVKHYFMGKS